MQSHFHTVNSLTKKNGIRPISKLEKSHSKHSLREYNIKTMLKLNLYLNLSKLLQENLGSSNQKQLHFPKQLHVPITVPKPMSVFSVNKRKRKKEKRSLPLGHGRSHGNQLPIIPIACQCVRCYNVG